MAFFLSLAAFSKPLAQEPENHSPTENKNPGKQRKAIELFAHDHHEYRYGENPDSGCPSEGQPGNVKEPCRIIDQVERNNRDEAA
jgi:hypothetical protein